MATAMPSPIATAGCARIPSADRSRWPSVCTSCRTLDPPRQSPVLAQSRTPAAIEHRVIAQADSGFVPITSGCDVGQNAGIAAISRRWVRALPTTLHQAISRLTTTLQLDRTRQQLARCSNGCLSAQSHDARFIDPQPKGDTEEGWIMPTNLIALIAQFLTPDMIARIASALGIDRTLAQKAIDAAVPAMLARLAGHASKPEGARQLSNVLAQQAPDALVK